MLLQPWGWCHHNFTEVCHVEWMDPWLKQAFLDLSLSHLHLKQRTNIDLCAAFEWNTELVLTFPGLWLHWCSNINPFHDSACSTNLLLPCLVECGEAAWLYWVLEKILIVCEFCHIPVLLYAMFMCCHSNHSYVDLLLCGTSRSCALFTSHLYFICIWQKHLNHAGLWWEESKLTLTCGVFLWRSSNIRFAASAHLEKLQLFKSLSIHPKADRKLGTCFHTSPFFKPNCSLLC